jgi:hypothetical protein
MDGFYFGKYLATTVSCKFDNKFIFLYFFLQGNRPLALKHLTTFLKSLETYYNPTNHGKWTMPLGALLNELVTSFSHRLKK